MAIAAGCGCGYAGGMNNELAREFVGGRGLFVTGTDTGVGKTVVTGAIARCLSGAGVSVGVFKPIATGCEHRREGLVSSDAEFLAHCSNSGFSLEEINPVRYAEAVTPSVAVERSGRAIDWAGLGQAYGRISEASDVTLVEGIGGLMVPIEPGYLVIDMMVDMALPAIVVAKNRLGVINHTLLTVEMCRIRGLKVAGVVVNGYRADGASLAEETNPRVISEVGDVPVLAVIPYESETSVEQGQLGPSVRQAAEVADWAGLAG